MYSSYCCLLLKITNFFFIDSKFVYGTPTKSTHINFSECKPNINLTPKTPRSKKYVSNEDIETKTPKTVRKRLAKGCSVIYNSTTNI